MANADEDTMEKRLFEEMMKRSSGFWFLFYFGCFTLFFLLVSISVTR